MIVANNFIFGKQYLPANTFIKDLVAYYKFDNNLIDSSGRNNHGTSSNILYTNGVSQQAINFGNDGLQREIIVPNTADFNFNDGNVDIPFTISLWFKSTPNCIFGFDNVGVNGSAYSGFNFSYYDGFYEFAKFSNIYNNYHFKSFKFYKPITNQLYTNLSIVNYNNNLCFIYVNGVVQNFTPITIGGVYLGMTNNLTGSFKIKGNANLVENVNSLYAFDEMAIWKNRALGTQEVLQLYTKGNLGQSLI